MKDDLIGARPQQININEYPNLTCECGCDVFEQVVQVKLVPGTLVGFAGETMFYPKQTLKCTKCGKIIDPETYTPEQKAEDTKKFSLTL